MTYIIAEPCVSTCDTACVEVCPVDCIHGPEDKTGAGAEAKEPGFDPEGKQLFYSELGEKTEQWIKNGKRHGMYTQWNSDNIIILKEKWKNGKLFKILIL